MTNLETRITRLHIGPADEAIFHPDVTIVEIADEAAGEYVVVSQQGDNDGKIAIDPAHWPAIRDAIDKMVSTCRDTGAKR